jgi:hypothetical protein
MRPPLPLAFLSDKNGAMSYISWRFKAIFASLTPFVTEACHEGCSTLEKGAEVEHDNRLQSTRMIFQVCLLLPRLGRAGCVQVGTSKAVEADEHGSVFGQSSNRPVAYRTWQRAHSPSSLANTYIEN